MAKCGIIPLPPPSTISPAAHTPSAKTILSQINFERMCVKKKTFHFASTKEKGERWIDREIEREREKRQIEKQKTKERKERDKQSEERIEEKNMWCSVKRRMRGEGKEQIYEQNKEEKICAERKGETQNCIDKQREREKGIKPKRDVTTKGEREADYSISFKVV